MGCRAGFLIYVFSFYWRRLQYRIRAPTQASQSVSFRRTACGANDQSSCIISSTAQVCKCIRAPAPRAPGSVAVIVSIAILIVPNFILFGLVCRCICSTTVRQAASQLRFEWCDVRWNPGRLEWHHFCVLEWFAQVCPSSHTSKCNW